MYIFDGQFLILLPLSISDKTVTRYTTSFSFFFPQERVSQYEQFVSDHQQYNDMYNGCIDWLNGIREKLSACSDVSGDRHAVQSRLDKIQVCWYFRYYDRMNRMPFLKKCKRMHVCVVMSLRLYKVYFCQFIFTIIFLFMSLK